MATSMAAASMAEQQPQQQQTMPQLTPSEKFFKFFQHEVTDLQEQIDRIGNHGTSGGERADAVDHCLAGIARLSNEVHDASAYLPAYDQRTYGDAIKALSSKLQDVRSAVAPKPKFSFRSGGPTFTAKKNASAISINDAAELANERRRQVPGYASDLSNESSLATTPAYLRSPAPEPADSVVEGADNNGPDFLDKTPSDGSHIRQPSFSHSTAVQITDHDGLHIMLPRSASHGTSAGTLSNLRRCVVDLSPPTSSTGRPFAGLTLKNISHSLIICGHVDGAAHLTRVSDSVIVVASRQFRMHESARCDVYLLTASRPIIEDCSAVRFAPLPAQYLSEGDRDGQTANQWQNVDDFKWLRSEPSPNWSVLDMPQRVREEVWRDVVPGGPELGTEEILKAVNVPK